MCSSGIILYTAAAEHKLILVLILISCRAVAPSLGTKRSESSGEPGIRRQLNYRKAIGNRDGFAILKRPKLNIELIFPTEQRMIMKYIPQNLP